MILVPLLVASLAAAPGCEVTDATLEWGFKESFRAYIDGSIANGEWATADGATYATPEFVWTGGTGTVDPETGEAEIAFTGSVRFTGHEGVLDTTIANPVVRLDGSTGTLLLDVSGPTMEGEQLDLAGVEFVALNGVQLSGSDEAVTADAVSELTADGATAFPNYQAGEAFDPVALTMPVDADCPPVITYEGSYEPLVPEESGPPPALFVVLSSAGVAVAGAITAAIVAVRRRRPRA